jgi:AcrR family transcriptional regulator
MSVSARTARTRLAPQERIEQILAAAAEIIVDQGVLPISLETVAQRLGVSKGLIYSYFPTQFDLANRLLETHLVGLAREVEQVLTLDDPRDAADRCAGVYFEHVARDGPLPRILLGDPFLAGRLDPAMTRTYERVMGRLARRLRSTYRLPSRESVAALITLAAIPEELGTLVFLKRLDPRLGREMCREMLLGGLEGLKERPPPDPA